LTINRQQLRQLVVVDIVTNSADFVARMLNVLATLSSPACTGPKQHTRSTLSSTFNKVDRVEFNFVVSVYRGLVVVISL